MQKFTMLKELKERDDKAVFKKLVAAEDAFRAYWHTYNNSDHDEACAEMYLGNSISLMLNDAQYKFACELTVKDINEFKIQEWVDCLCTGAVSSILHKCEVYCAELEEAGCWSCCARNTSLAYFIRMMFPDEAKEIADEICRINGEEVEN